MRLGTFVMCFWPGVCGSQRGFQAGAEGSDVHVLFNACVGDAGGTGEARGGHGID